MVCYRNPQTQDSGGVGWWVGLIRFEECIFMHTSRECIFRTYFRQLLMLV